MFSEPDDPAVFDRMHAAFVEAATLLDCSPGTAPPEVWGHNGRTLGGPVTYGWRRGWLRVLEAPADKHGGKLWTGTWQAAAALPAEVPRPQLLHTGDWIDGVYAYRGELSSYVPAPICSRSPDLPGEIDDLPGTWWSQLRLAFDRITATRVPAGRPPVISQDYVHRAIPKYIGEHEIDTSVRRWSLAHGDLHWANLTYPELTILDWEGFGPAPYGFDAAHLHVYTLRVPQLAARVRVAFSNVLSTPDGRLAEITVAAVLLQAAERDAIHARLAPHVKRHVQRLLEGNDAG